MRCEIKAEVVTKVGTVTRTYRVKAANPTQAECNFKHRLLKGWKPKGVSKVTFLSADVAPGKGYKSASLTSLLGTL